MHITKHTIDKQTMKLDKSLTFLNIY